MKVKQKLIVYFKSRKDQKRFFRARPSKMDLAKYKMKTKWYTPFEVWINLRSIGWNTQPHTREIYHFGTAINAHKLYLPINFNVIDETPEK